MTHLAGVEAVAQDLADAPAQHERDVVQLQLGQPRAQQRDSARRARLRRHSHQAPQRPEARQHLDDCARARNQGSPRSRLASGRTGTRRPSLVQEMEAVSTTLRLGPVGGAQVVKKGGVQLQNRLVPDLQDGRRLRHLQRAIGGLRSQHFVTEVERLRCGTVRKLARCTAMAVNRLAGPAPTCGRARTWYTSLDHPPAATSRTVRKSV